jgi:putative pyruvate formate lyase activating enzyme
MLHLSDMLSCCRLCPRRCRADRTKGETGFCGLTADILIDCAVPHFGEEPPISGTKGAGTIFLSSCNLRCIYCQNHQISHHVIGKQTTPEALSGTMVALQEQGCHNIELVTPTPQMPRVMEALSRARDRGLTVPLVYNCGGYEDPEIVKLLENRVDIYMPDFKYADARLAESLSGAKDYVRYALASIGEMVRQVGDGLETVDDIAQRGIIIRHLVLPGMIANSLDVLTLIKKHISTAVPVSIMSQYTPMASQGNHPQLGRRISPGEYDRVVRFALDIGFETIFCQDVDDNNLVPDFEKATPFGPAGGETRCRNDTD